MKTAEPTETAPQITEEALAKFFASPQGEAALNRYRGPLKPVQRPPIPDEIIDSHIKLVEDENARYVPVDPKTGEPHAEAEQFFWCIKGATRVSVTQSGGQFRLDFYLVQYHRNQTEEVQIMKEDGTQISRTRHKANAEYGYSMDGAWVLKKAADRFIDSEDFLRTFKQDKLPVAETFETLKDKLLKK
jgi:hypothetical protein